MASVQFIDVQSRPTEFLDFTSVTLDEFQQLVPPFEAAFQVHMAAWRLDGKPRTARPVCTGPAAPSASPLLPMTERNGASSAPKTLLHRRNVIAARKRTTR